MLGFRGRQIKDVTAFVVRTLDVPDEADFHRWAAQPQDERRLESVFARFGLPAFLPAA